MADLLLGARLTLAGGRAGWSRTVLMACGVGIGVALLLLAAAIPSALDAREARMDGRLNSAAYDRTGPAADTLLITSFNTGFRDSSIWGRVVRAEGPHAPVPPGVTALPGPGEMVVSPALRDLLGSPDGRLLADRFGGARVIGTIGDPGLTGPGELAFYLGSDTLTTEEGADRVVSFGIAPSGSGLALILMLLVVITVVVLLLPIAVFVGAAVRFGGERRDRRLAALRLVGADLGMTRRIAAGETMVAALLGLGVGGLLFLLGRQLAPLVTLQGISVYAGDVRPAVALLLIIVLAVPVLTVTVTMVAMRGVIVEPLGVVRRTGQPRRRLWWRLALPILGLALLLPLIGNVTSFGPLSQVQVAVGAVLLLTGTATLLPWLIDLAVRRLRGGSVPWQLAIRRLPLDSATSARLVGAITVAVAGTIALQGLFTGVQTAVTAATGSDPTRGNVLVQLETTNGFAALAPLRAAGGTVKVSATITKAAGPDAPGAAPMADGSVPVIPLRIGDCAALAEYGRLDRCADGDVFLTGQGSVPDGFTPGTPLSIGRTVWTLPAATRTVPIRPDPVGWNMATLLVTPGAIDLAQLGPVGVDAIVTTDPRDRDAIEHLRNAAASIAPQAAVRILTATRVASDFVNIRRGLYVGAMVTLLLIAASMLVSILEQLREQRRLLAMLSAVGTPRGVLVRSMIWQATVPLAIGLPLAVLAGLVLGGALLTMVRLPISLNWPAVGLSVGLAVAVLGLATALSLPTMSRLRHADGLRAE